jgi:hypothetical protein
MSLFDRFLTRVTGTRTVPETAASSLAVRPPAPVPLEFASWAVRMHDDSPEAYPYGEDTPLIRFNAQDVWGIVDSYQGCAVLGETGSGKSTAGKHIAKALLYKGYGGLVTTVKSTDIGDWLQWCAETGRLNDVILVHPDQSWQWNWIEHIYQQHGEGAGHTWNAVQAFVEVCSAASEDGHRNHGQDSFWIENAKRLLRNTLDLLVSAEVQPSMDHILAILHGRPSRTPSGELHWPEGSLLHECLMRAEQSSYAARHGIDLRAIRGYWQHEAAIAGEDRTMAGILATLTGMAEPLMSGPVKQLFCCNDPANFEPEWSLYGRVIILALPTLIWRDVGRVSQLLFKYLWQRSVTRRQGLPAGQVPVFWFCDEAQNFFTSYDWRYQAEARSSWAATVALTQTLSGIYAMLDPGRAQAQAEALMANLSTKIALRNSDATTNKWMSEAIGRDIVHRRSKNVGWNENWSEGDNSGVSISGSEKGSTVNIQDGTSGNYSIGHNQSFGSQETMDFLLPPRIFTMLAPGQAIVFKAGRRWHRTGNTFLDVQFPA